MPHAQPLADDAAAAPAPARCGVAAPLPWVASPAAYGLHVSRQFAQCRREGGQLAVLWVEIDGLSGPGANANEASGASGACNDAHDAVVQAVSQRLRNRVREGDEVLRVGERGFAVLLLAAGTREAEIAGQRLLQTVRGAYGVDGRLMQVDVRLGAAVFPEAGRNGAELAQAARAACAAGTGRAG